MAEHKSSSTHMWRRRRARVEDAWLRLRHRFAGRMRRPPAPAALSQGAHSAGSQLARVMGGLRDAANGVQARLGGAGRLMTRRAAPLRHLAQAGAGRLQAARARWWDPIFLKLQPYWRSRRKAELVRGVPALVLILALVSGIAMVTGARPSVTRNAALLRDAQMALSGKEYAKAAIIYQRLLQVGGNDNEARFGLARSWAAMGDVPQAAMLLKSLAPDDAAGYLPAHRVRAFLILESPQASQEDLEIARGHLERVLAADPEDADAHGMMGMLYLKEDKIREARDQFAASASARPETALNAALLSRQLGDKEAMLDFASRAAAFNRGTVKNGGGQVPVETVLQLAQSLCLQKKYSDAVETIEELLSRSDRDRLVRAILDICKAWESDLDAHPGAQDLERFRLVKTALTYDASAHDWQIRALDLTGGASIVRPVVVQLLQKLAGDNAAGAEVCFFLGMEAFGGGDVPGARKYLERSLALQPDHAATANNLACALLTGHNQDAGLALKYVERALAAVPGNPMFHETRGEALLALQRWGDAAAEFEYAMPNLPARREAHQGLAVAYDHMGFPQRARQQEKLAAGEGAN